MKVEQIYTGCLAHGAYYIESEGEVAIIDPLREVQPYIEKAAKENAKIKYIFETHFHADFVSGHLTLSEATGAPIIFGPTAQPSFKAIVARDNETFKLGNITIKVLHTPGHTMESSTFLLIDENGKEHSIFSGDTLFLGDVGRPDLAQKAAHMTQEELAATLYKSLRERIMTLPDDVIVYPGHGAGSACGKNMMKETVDTLGNQKKVNYALRADMTEEEFVTEVLDGLTAPPAYFPLNAKLNKTGYADIKDVLAEGSKALTPEQFEQVANQQEALVLDVRHQDNYRDGHVPGSIFIGLNGDFAPWVGAMVKDVNQALLLVVEEDKVEETITRLARVGFDNVLGYLGGGVEAWKAAGKEADTVQQVEAKALENAGVDATIIDVRKDGEYTAEHVEGAVNIPLMTLNDNMDTFKKDGTIYLHCAGGYRSMIANAILKSRGIHNVVDVAGGFKAIAETNVPVTAYVCPSTL